METPSIDRESATPDQDYAPASVIAEHYRVERELGRGGMATVYLCTDLRDQKQVAIKVLRHELGSAVIIERFLREIAFASELDHPQIPKVLGSGVIDDVPYYVMTYIDGESLKKLLEREKQLPIADALRIACAIIEPTAYAHKRGIVHRDIKPDNILISKDGVFVLDFGIARAIIESGGDRLTSTGIGIGTPAYMSPEQALGDRNLDVRSDIYSIGCVVYEMIAGIPPFVGPTAQVIISRRFAAPPPPMRELREGVPEDLEYAVDRALAKSPADRWATAAEFGEALKACATGEHRFSSGSQKSWWRQPHRRATVATLGTGLVAASAFAWSAAYREPFNQGQRALAEWDFNGAAADLKRAVSTRPDDPRSQFWLAQVMMLKGDSARQWKPFAIFASDHRAELSAPVRSRIDGMLALAAGQIPTACKNFGDAAKAAGTDSPDTFISALAYADCLRQDQTVLPDKTSPSGYRFKVSYQQVDSLYEALLERHRASPGSFLVLIPRLERVLNIDKGFLRLGILAGAKQTVFLALPSLAADTLLYVPLPLPPNSPWRSDDVEGANAAVRRNRQRLRALALDWVRTAPDEPRSHETLARVLESTGELTGGDVSALQEIETARRLTSSVIDDTGERYLRQVRLASAEVRLHLRQNRFDRAALLADTILAWRMPPDLDPDRRDAAGDLITSLAALRGRASMVIEIEQHAAAHARNRLLTGEEVTLPPALGVDEIAFSHYAAFGGPRDSILAMLGRVKKDVTALIPSDQAELWRISILRRPLPLAAPVVGPKVVADELGIAGDAFVRALAMVGRGNKAAARIILDSLAKSHSQFAPGEITMDVVYPEAWLRTVVGDTAGATRDLDNALRGLPAALPSILRDLNLAACLVRVMALRAELAARDNQPAVAKYWANAVLQLWGSGDPIVRSTVEAVRGFR